MGGHVAERRNRLANEKSPYLQEHASNPVDWYPWSEEALRKAKNDNKPVLLSIGYSSCHWCHRLRTESFEDEKVAQLINKNFVAIKVDREERPEVDAYYMNAVQAMTGGGGWPLTVFLTPDLQPFYGGTYFPPEPRYGMPSFTQVLEFAVRVWKERKEEALETSSQVAKTVQSLEVVPAKGQLSRNLLDGAYEALAAAFDDRHGGFGSAPKFPLPLSISFLLRYYFRNRNQLALTVATKSLDAIAAGGIRDHIGGGFHRYATDRDWLVPHFEKMLYDNALLSSVYTDAFKVTGSESYSQVVKQTLGWLSKEMLSPEGGFYSAQDADTAEGEGVFYTWTPDEVEGVLGGGEGKRFGVHYGVTKTGNFEGGRSVLHLSASKEGDQLQEETISKLYDARLKRPRPKTDSKILTSWNGLTISAFAKAGAAFDDERYVNTSERAADFILSKCIKGDTLLRRFAGGEAGISGTLEDYAFLVQGLLDLFEATGRAGWLNDASRLTDLMTERLLDSERGGFFLAAESVPGRLKENHDGPTPSGNSVACMNLLRLSEITGKERWRGMAESTIKYFQAGLEEHPAEHSLMLASVDLLLNGFRELVLVTPRREDAKSMIGVVARSYVPDAVIVIADSANRDRLAEASPLLEGRVIGPKPMAYVCRNSVCQLPSKTPEELMAQLSSTVR